MEAGMEAGTGTELLKTTKTLGWSPNYSVLVFFAFAFAFVVSRIDHMTAAAKEGEGAGQHTGKQHNGKRKKKYSWKNIVYRTRRASKKGKNIKNNIK
jgi:hypothetical protein